MIPPLSLSLSLSPSLPLSLTLSRTAPNASFCHKAEFLTDVKLFCRLWSSNLTVEEAVNERASVGIKMDHKWDVKTFGLWGVREFSPLYMALQQSHFQVERRQKPRSVKKKQVWGTARHRTVLLHNYSFTSITLSITPSIRHPSSIHSARQPFTLLLFSGSLIFAFYVKVVLSFGLLLLCFNG